MKNAWRSKACLFLLLASPSCVHKPLQEERVRSFVQRQFELSDACRIDEYFANVSPDAYAELVRNGVAVTLDRAALRAAMAKECAERTTDLDILSVRIQGATASVTASEPDEGGLVVGIFRIDGAKGDLRLTGFTLVHTRAGSGGINVVSATYGANCGAAAGNAMAHIAEACDAKSDCSYVIDYQVIGDPAVGCAKDYSVEWSCGPNGPTARAWAQAEAGYKSTVQLSCR